MNSPLFELARVLVRLDHVAPIASYNANHSTVRPAEKLRVTNCVADHVQLAVQQPTEGKRVGNQIDTAFIFARADS